MWFVFFCWCVVSLGWLELGWHLGKKQGRKLSDREWAVWAEHGAL